MGKNYDLLSIASLDVIPHLWGRKNIKTFITDHWKQFSYLYFLPDIRIFVLTLDVLQQLVHQGCTSSAVHQGSCQMQPAVCRLPSLIFIRLQVTQRTGLYAFVQWGGNIAGGGGAKATDEVSSVRELRRREGKKYIYIPDWDKTKAWEETKGDVIPVEEEKKHHLPLCPSPD